MADLDISIGSVLMLSQTAWRTGRAFTSGRKDAPYEFREVQLELSRLAKSLKLLAESLFSEDTESLITQATTNTQAGINAVIQFSKQTLDYLQSLVDQYQQLPKPPPGGRVSAERSWSDMVIKNYQSMVWTPEGGTMRDLRDMLHMHTSTTALIRQALDSKSSDRVEWIVSPIFDLIRAFYHNIDRDISENVEDIERLVESLISQSPVIAAAFDRVNSVSSEMSHLSLPAPVATKPANLEFHKPRPPLLQKITTQSTDNQTSAYSPSTSPGLPSGSEIALSDPGDSGSSVGQASPTSRRSSLFKAPDRRLNLGRSLPPLPATPEIIGGMRRSASFSSSIQLPPAAWEDPDTPRRSKTYTHMPAAEEKPVKLTRSTSTASQQQSFEKSLFKNSAIYCDLRGKAVEYVKPFNGERYPGDKTLETAMENCRICIVRRRETRPNGQESFTTSIWAFSDDLSARFQQKLPDSESIVPFASYFQDEKISITYPTEVFLHDIAHDSPPLKSVRSSWVNYIFEDTAAATTFQNTIYGNKLVGTFKTDKTTRIHDGIAGALSYQEQMCAMENLRVWEDESTSKYFMMIHFSAQFRSKGYLTCALNDRDNPVKFKDESGKVVKIKGLKIPPDENPDLGRNKRNGDSKKLITGAKVEFKNEQEKGRFMDMVWDLQYRAINPYSRR